MMFLTSIDERFTPFVVLVEPKPLLVFMTWPLNNLKAANVECEVRLTGAPVLARLLSLKEVLRASTPSIDEFNTFPQL